MTTQPSCDLHLRSYDRIHWGDRHEYAQLVLPLHGEVLLDIEERCGRLDPLHGALVAPGAWHAQSSQAANGSLIVDVDGAAFHSGPWQQLLERPFVTLGPAARKLVEFMGLMAGENAPPRAMVQGWVPLLLDTLGLDAPRATSRLAALLARIEAAPGQAWSTESMARAANLSVSRLHARFREELDSTPHAWLLTCRLDRARELLAGSARSVADIALACGFADQAGLTRAMRRALDTTPAAYRRASCENGTKPQ
ncbi:AraC family transcriptional regulator [Telluria beijingensis]|uniref:AraC family transcriptional regulator n=1 Tax=Telluria beijingensis TaxID=3068633 RepID=UPI002795E4AA|nr:AraC family transcriptional regulator [Massilia sp. REN29]